jgi:hypothetical protein
VQRLLENPAGTLAFVVVASNDYPVTRQPWGLLVLAAAICGCSKDGTAPDDLVIAGVWNQGARLHDTVNQQTHYHTGYFSFSEEKSGFSGEGQQSGVCTGSHGDYTGPLADGSVFALREGMLQGNHLSFKTNLCSYEGTLSDDKQHITGTASCAYQQDGTDFVWTGDWLANRAP